ncbi:MAG: hypothetical protein EA365_00020 [Gloeocapsa sp. DLM2.Bin57]|nr:MAG: hypothetical protein EA365_00020 [Gloeocapsa sp. DLM2.Bin57]
MNLFFIIIRYLCVDIVADHISQAFSKKIRSDQEKFKGKNVLLATVKQRIQAKLNNMSPSVHLLHVK